MINKEITDGDELIYDDDSSQSEISSDIKEHVKKLKKRLSRCLSERQEYLDGWQRAKADYLNMKKGETERLRRGIEFAKSELFIDIISVVDNFELAFSTGGAWEKIDKDWIDGIEKIYLQFKTILKKNGLREFSELGEDFDPGRHDCVAQVSVKNSKQSGKIIKIIQKGYEFENCIIRPARVTVGEYLEKKETK